MKRADSLSNIDQCIANRKRGRAPIRSFRDENSLEKERSLEKIQAALRLALLAPSHGNFQPTRYMIISHQDEKERLSQACFNNRLVLESSFLIAILSDTQSVYEKAQDIIEDDRARGAISEKEAKSLSLLFELGFSSAPLGIGKWCKKLLVPFMRLFFRIPEVPIANYKSWLSKQAGMGAMALIQGLEVQELHWSSIEWYDERRALQALDLSRSRYYLPFLIAVGKAQDISPVERGSLSFDEAVLS